MLLHLNRVNNVDRYVSKYSHSAVVSLVVQLSSTTKEKAIQCGFEPTLDIGMTVLPIQCGPVSKRNSEGKIVPDKSKPLEVAFRQSEWRYMEFRGRYDRIERTKIVEIPYKRYPRIVVPPQSVELKIAKDPTGAKLVQVNKVLSVADKETLKHCINLMLEIFGQCEIRDSSLSPVMSVPERKLNWEILPKGCMPWVKLKSSIEEIRKRAKGSNIEVIDSRFECINEFKPDFYALGRAGFQGYIIFAFEEKGIYIYLSQLRLIMQHIFSVQTGRLCLS